MQDGAYKRFAFGSELGISVPGESRAIARLMGADGHEVILVSRFDESLLAFRSIAESSRVIQPSPDAQQLLIYEHGKNTVKKELFYGSGYLSQSSRKLSLELEVDSVVSVSYRGERKQIQF